MAKLQSGSLAPFRVVPASYVHKLLLMRLLVICCLSLSISSLATAQVFSDTTYFKKDNAIKEIRYGAKAYAQELYSKSAMFMRGLKAGDKVLRLDSIRQYAPTGAFLGTKDLTQERIKESYDRWGQPASGSGTLNQKSKPLGLLSPKTIAELEGRIGMVVERPFLMRGTAKSAEALLERRIDDYEAIQLRVMKVSEAASSTGTLSARARLTGGYQSYTISFAEGEKEDSHYPIVLRGYHLNESDFLPKDQVTEKQFWDGSKEDVLYLRLRSTEKLMSIYREGVLLTRLPVGRQLDELNLKLLKPGNYLLEIRDLTTNERRYHGVRR